MKSMKKIVLTLLIASTGLIFTSCNKNDTPSKQEEKFELRLNESNIQMIIGDTTKLIASNSLNLEDIKLTWKSEDETVAKVNQDGGIEAISVGETTVSVLYKDYHAECAVEVTSDIYLPTLHFQQEVEISQNIAPNSTLNLATYIAFNNKRFYDADVTYDVINPIAGKVDEKGIFHAGNSINCSTDVTVRASWRNFDVPSLTKKVSITIASKISVILNNGELSDINLYTVDQVVDKTYKTIEEISSIKCFENNNEQTVNDVAILENKAIDNPSLKAVEFTYDSINKTAKIKALREGSAILKVSFIGSNSKMFEKTFNVSVNLPIYKIEEAINYFSILDGKYFDEILNEFVSLGELFPAGSSNILRVYQDDKELESDGNVVKGVTSSMINSEGVASLTLYNEVMGLKLNLITFKKIVTNINDFFDIFSSTEGSKGKEKVIDGFYYLINDIDATGTDLYLKGGRYPTIFGGVFEGNGHIISNVNIIHNAADEWGLFGFGIKGEIRNVAFSECEFDGCLSGLFAHHAESGCYINNVYLNVKVNSTIATPAYGIMYSTYGYLKITNTVIDMPEVLVSDGRFGPLAIHKLANGCNDVIIVSPKVNGIGEGYQHRSYVTQQEADEDKDPSIRDDYKHIVGPYVSRYDNMASLRIAKRNLSSFSRSIWDISTGAPVFKGLVY